MLNIKSHPEFIKWLEALLDVKVRAVISAWIERLRYGLMGDVDPIGKGISELRIHLGAGWRVYFRLRGIELIVLLAGGSKWTQKKDIR